MSSLLLDWKPTKIREQLLHHFKSLSLLENYRHYNTCDLNEQSKDRMDPRE